jgi:hypothetical protein
MRALTRNGANDSGRAEVNAGAEEFAPPHRDGDAENRGDVSISATLNGHLAGLARFASYDP